ncbi:glycoside hydrolase family 2 protein [Phycisphaera mikurensis]|uniref:beta-galactosidase n=1 Tax=Phycisphaera mikurensis (strain NBRC 102666 / KCTC 22515 / FYK2301M01) TaxID=1142394 RepID=I0IBL1_PHYMF|nr:glycoside hydrolase family 2 [Phycisphaera mikurensis]MBB6442822.1 hypothetical protein [Phycisphaera mikurensis]BAM02649.1 putative glycoside hydrolase [Phycisphaera mikurensis NBRC 102666]
MPDPFRSLAATLVAGLLALQLPPALAQSTPEPEPDAAPTEGAGNYIEGDPKAALEKDRPQPTGVVSVGAAEGGSASGVLSILPPIRLTPRKLSFPHGEDRRVDLNGTWDFVPAVPEGFDGTFRSIDDWQTLEVPGHPALGGHEVLDPKSDRRFGYHRRFEVPASFEGGRTVLRFEGVDGFTKIWINGEKVGENDIATLPTELDVTDFVKPGEANELVLTIEGSLVTFWSMRKIGGITREVYLQHLPDVNLARLHVDTDLTPGSSEGGNGGVLAAMRAHVRVANQGDALASPVTIAFTLRDADGEEVALQHLEGPLPLLDVLPGQTLEATLPLHATGVLPWTAETPNLYTLEAELQVDGEPTMSARQRFGFREVEVAGPHLLVNGSPVKLWATNYHITYPGLSESVPKELIKNDIRLFKEANFNAARSRPTPPIQYVDLCDEMGFYTTIEGMISLMIYAKGPLNDHGADPAISVPYRRHIATMIESYYSNPSVITWGLANESPYYDYFKVAALGAAAADPTRPLFFGSDARKGVDIPLMDMNDDHYPRKAYGEGQPSYGIADVDELNTIENGAWDYPADRPNLFTEWLHVHVNNVKEIAYDPGIDDFWGYPAEVHAKHFDDKPHFAGGFQFKGAPYRGIGASPNWRGVFDEDRRVNDVFWAVKKSHSPVRIFEPASGRVEGDEAVWPVRNRFAFTNLQDVAFAWASPGGSGEASPSVAPMSDGELALPAAAARAGPIEVEVLAADGAVLDAYELTLADAAEEEGVAGEASAWRLEEKGRARVLTRGDVVATIGAESGLLESVTVGGEPVVIGPVTLSVIPSQLRNFKWQGRFTLVNQAWGWEAGRVEVDTADDGTVTVSTSGSYTRFDVNFTQAFAPDGTVRVEADATYTGGDNPGEKRGVNIFNHGIRVPVHQDLDTLFWEREGLWSVYPGDHIGRLEGETRATGDPRWADAREAYDPEAAKPNPRPWPWSQDLSAGVTRDFRSTKFNLVEGGLAAANGRRIVVIGNRAEAFEDRRHLHAAPLNDDLDGNIFTEEKHGPQKPGYDLSVLSFHNGGTEPHLTKSLRFGEHIARNGWELEADAAFRFDAGG